MAPRYIHLKFDNILKDEKIIELDTNGTIIHQFLDKGISDYGGRHRDMDPDHNAEKIRSWLKGIFRKLRYSQRTKTDFIRIAYGHILVDKMYDTNKPPKDIDSFLTKVFKEYKLNDFDSKKF